MMRKRTKDSIETGPPVADNFGRQIGAAVPAPFWQRILTSIGLAIALAILVSANISAEVPTGYQEYYILGNEELTWRAFRAIYEGPSYYIPPMMCSTISLVATANYQMVYYDHWEDGYEVNILSPLQATTEVYTLTLGQTLSLTSTADSSAPPIHQYVPVAPNRNPADLRYDSGDRLVTSGGPIALSHALWPYDSSWAGGAWEIYSYQSHANTYTYQIPVGENLYVQGGGDDGIYGDFRDVYVQVSPYEDNTTILIDNNVGQSVNLSLNRGQTYSSQGYVNSSNAPAISITAGSTLLTDKPVQVGLITGSDSPSSGFQGRFLVILPSYQWGADYVIPVPRGFSLNSIPPRDAPAELYLANPNDFPITVHAYDAEGQHTFVISATQNPSATLPYSLIRGDYAPTDHAVRFTSNEGAFNVIMTADTSKTDYDWGFSAIPSKYLSQDYYIPWAPGTVNLSANGSPVWVTPVANGTVFHVDYSPVDGIADDTFVLDILEQRRIFDPDNDNTGMHIWASEKFACVWGEDPRTAGITRPYLDMGLSILPLQQNWLDSVMSLSATALPSIVPPTGGVVTFTLAAHVHQGDIGNLSFTNTLPLRWTYLPGSATVTDPAGNVMLAEPQTMAQLLTWTPDVTLQKGQTLTITFQAGITDTTGISVSVNHAEVLGQHIQSGVLFNPYDDATLYVSPLNLVYEVSDNQAPTGQTLVYTLTYRNQGDMLTTNTTLHTVLSPQYVAFATASDGGIYQADSGTITWTLGDLQPGDSHSVTYTVRIHEFTEDGAVIESAGQIRSDQTYAARSNIVHTTVQAAHLVLAASGPTLVYPGDSITYTLMYANEGGGDAWGVLISNTIPLSTTYIPGSLAILTDTTWTSLTDAPDGDAGDFISPVLTLRPGRVPAGATGQIRYSVRVATEDVIGRSILNVATIDHQQDGTRNSNLVITHIAALRLLKQAAQAMALPGSVITYTLNYQNLSTTQAQTNIAVLEAVPDFTQFISASVSSADQIAYSWDGIHWSITLPITPVTHIRWRDVRLDPRASVTLTMAVQVHTTLPFGAIVYNQAYISSTQSYLLAHDWLTSNAVNVPLLNLWLEKQTGASTVYAGGTLTYAIQVGNDGSGEAVDLHITDTLPAGMTYFPHSIYGVGSDDSQAPLLRWNPVTASAGTAVSVGYTAQLDSDLTPGTILTNTALLESPYRYYTTAPVTVVVATAADLRLTKTATPDPVRPEGVLTYTLNYTNTGPSDAQNVFLTDWLPSNVKFGRVIATTPPLQGPTQIGQWLGWYTPTLPAQTAGAVTFTVYLSADHDLALTNIAAITSTTTDPQWANNIVTTTTPIVQLVDLMLTQTEPLTTTAPGDPLTYTLEFTNIGMADAANVTLRDTPPENFVLTAIVSHGVAPILIQSEPDYIWELPTFAVNAWGVLTLTGSITPGLSSGITLTNTACITPSVADDNPGNNCAVVTTVMSNILPIPQPDYILVDEGASVSILNNGATSLLSNDTDPNQEPLTVVITPVVNVAYGVLTLQAQGAFTYTHNGGEETADGFVYQVCDAGEPPLCANAAVSITISPVNDAPVAAGDALTVTEGSFVYLPAPGILGNDSDSDLPPDILTATLVTSPAFGTLILHPDGAVTYTHSGGEEPYDSFRYQVCDDGAPVLCAAADVSITIISVGDPPVATDDAVTVAEGDIATATVTGATSVLANDYDPDRPPAPLTATLVSNAAHGTLMLVADGTFTYTHDGSENHSDSFVYRACKTTTPQRCDTANVAITITPVNDPPTISAFPGLSLYINATSAPQPFTIGDADTPLDMLTLTAASSNAALMPPPQIGFDGVGITRTVTLTPSVRMTGTARITVSVSDGAGDASSAFTLTVIKRPPICLPVVLHEWPILAPDLVVESMTVTPYNVQLVIANHGQTPVTRPFFVDVYVRPITVPTHVNQTWTKVGNEGMVWGVLWDALPLDPGESLQLWYRGPYYISEYSYVNWPIRAGDWVYAQVDSANTSTDYGAILEVDEIGEGPYNNILGIQFLGDGNTSTEPPPVPPPPGPPQWWADLPRRE